MLGSNLAFLPKETYEVTGVNQIAVSMPENKISCFDLMDENRLYEDLEMINPEVVIHTAAVVNVDRCEQEPAYAR